MHRSADRRQPRPIRCSRPVRTERFSRCWLDAIFCPSQWVIEDRHAGGNGRAAVGVRGRSCDSPWSAGR